jgi:hypothetical protein
MTFQEIAAEFERSYGGTDDFKRLYKGAHELMRSDDANAALYFVIGVAAHAYVLKYEDQAVTTELAESAKATLVGFNGKICRALASDAATRLALLGEVVCDYQFRVSCF